MKKWLVPVLLFVLLAMSAAPASAITGKYIEDFEHPFVGLLVMYDESGEFIGRCSGSLLTPTVFLTAGHCVEGAATARVYFQQDAGANYDPALGYDPVTGYPDYCADGTLGTTCATSDELYSYGYPAGFPETKDAALVILDQPIQLDEYGILPYAGILDSLATQRGLQDITFTNSGYGLTYSSPVKVESYRERLMSQGQLVNLRSDLTKGFNFQTTNNPGVGGGTCSGDSGGPVFYGGYESNLIVGITSFGLNPWCRGTDFAYRADQQALIDWILETVPEDQAALIEFAAP